MALMMMFERGMKRRRTALAGLATALLLAAAPALRAESDHDQALRWLIYGNVLYKQGELKDAEKAYRKVTALDPANKDGWQGLGNVLSDQDKAKAAAEAYAKQDRPQEAPARAKPKPQAQPAPEPAPALADGAPPTRFALGVGYPDVRARLNLIGGLDLEAKAAFADGMQAYSGRLIWNFVDLGPLKVTLGGEGGYVSLGTVATYAASGAFCEGFVGLEYPIARRLRLSVDAGEAVMSASAGGSSYATTDVIYNTALYLYLF